MSKSSLSFTYSGVNKFVIQHSSIIEIMFNPAIGIGYLSGFAWPGQTEDAQANDSAVIAYACTIYVR